MITRAMDRCAYIRVEQSRFTYSRFSPLAVVGVVIACAALVLVLFLLTGVCEETRGRFIEKLDKQKGLVETNESLKMELAAITQRGYVEFAARERLGLKRPEDKEVVVVR